MSIILNDFDAHAVLPLPEAASAPAAATADTVAAAFADDDVVEAPGDHAQE
jgi:hypothetical protein